MGQPGIGEACEPAVRREEAYLGKEVDEAQPSCSIRLLLQNLQHARREGEDHVWRQRALPPRGGRDRHAPDVTTSKEVNDSCYTKPTKIT